MKDTLSFIRLTLLILVTSISQNAIATENKTAKLTDVMATLKTAYQQHTDRNRAPLSVPSAINAKYQALLTAPAPSNQKVSAFIKIMQNNIADFTEAERFYEEANIIRDMFDRCLMALRIKIDLPASLLAIDATYFDMLESDNFTGGDLLAYEMRYLTALRAHTEDGLNICEAEQTLYQMDVGFNARLEQLTSTEKLTLTNDNKVISTTLDEGYELIKQKQLSAANKNFQHAIALQTKLNTKIASILKDRMSKRKSLTESHTTLVKEAKSLESEISRLTKRIKGYLIDLEDPCDSTTVDYSCAERCPDVRQWDVIFGRYKNAPDYQCLSKCNSAEQDRQAYFHREEAYCVDDRRRIISKAEKLDSQRNHLIDKYNRRSDEIRAIESELKDK